MKYFRGSLKRALSLSNVWGPSFLYARGSSFLYTRGCFFLDDRGCFSLNARGSSSLDVRGLLDDARGCSFDARGAPSYIMLKGARRCPFLDVKVAFFVREEPSIIDTLFTK